MTGHYSGNDPGTGCALMILAGIGILLALALLMLAGRLIPQVVNTILQALP